MEKDKSVKFVRIGGRVVPIRIKKDGNVDKRHVSEKKLAESASKLNSTGGKTKKWAKMGGLVGAGTGAVAGAITSQTGGGIRHIPRGVWRAGLVGAGLGAIFGSISVTNKQKVANKLKNIKEYHIKNER